MFCIFFLRKVTLFIFIDTQVGALRIWNVSKSTPIGSIKLKKTGFHALTVITCDNNTTSTTNGYSQGPVSSTSSAAAPPSFPLSGDIQLPPAQILCTFLDGGVGLYDLGKRKWSFLRDMVREGYLMQLV